MLWPDLAKMICAFMRLPGMSVVTGLEIEVPNGKN